MPTSTGMSKIRSFIETLISYGRYRIGTTFHTVPIHEISIDGNTVHVYLLIDHNTVGTINLFQLYDKDGDLFEDKPDSVIKDSAQGVLVRFTFLIQEV